VTFSATVIGGAVDGTVQFEVNGVVVGSGTLGNAPDLNTATFTTSSLAAGSYAVTAVYSGDSTYNGSVATAASPLVVTTTYGAPTISGPTSTSENTAVSGLVITPAAGDSVSYFQITGITGGTLYYNGGSSQITNGAFISVASGAAGLEFIPTTNAVASGSFTVQEATAANSSGLVGATSTATVTIAAARSVDLSSYYNTEGITSNGTTFSGGLDGDGNAYSATALGSSVSWNGITFTLGAANEDNVISGTGQTLVLPEGNYSSITFLGTATNGNQTSQQFVIHYSDGTSTTVTQSLSDWAMSQNYAGESVVTTTSYRNTSNGGSYPSTFGVYAYSLSVNPAKTVESITLPNDGNVKIVSLVTQATLDAPTNLVATAASNGSVGLSWTASDSTVSGYNVYRYSLGGSPTLIASGVNGTTYTDTTGVAGNTYYYVVKAANGSAISPASNATNATVANASAYTEVDLSGQYNLTGIVGDGTGFSGGLDGQGNALSETEVGTTLSWNGVGFSLALTGSTNVIQAHGQSISLPSSSYSTVDVLATSVNGNQANQTFTITYTDGTTQTVTQSISDWAMPQSYSGESIALSTSYRDTAKGGRTSSTFDVYGYSFTVDSSKTIASITLPDNRNVDVLAITVVDSVSSASNLTVTVPSSTAADLSWTAASGGSITGYNIYRGTIEGGESLTPLNSTPLSSSTTSYVDTSAVPGNTYYYVVKAVNGPATSSASNEAEVTMPTSSSSISVDLSSDYNLAGIVADGSHFSGGIDGNGNALSATELGTSQTWNGITFNIAPATTSPATNNVIQAAGQTIGLPNGSYSEVEILATAVNGSQTNQTFTVRYTDGTVNTYSLSMSDWSAAQGFSGESVAAIAYYRDTSSGGGTGGDYFVYGYALEVNTGKTVESITLPNDKNVDILSMAAGGVNAAAPVVTASDNASSTYTVGSSAVPVDSRVSVASSDTELTSATVTISPGTFQAGDLLVFNNQNNISGSYNTATGVLTLTGAASVVDYQAALDSVTFSTTSTNTTSRNLTIVAADHLLQSNTVFETVNVTL